MQYPIMQEVFESYVLDTGEAFYSFGITYSLIRRKKGKTLLKIHDIAIIEIDPATGSEKK